MATPRQQQDFPHTGVIMFRENDTGVVLVNADGQEVTIRCRAGEELELQKTVGERGETLTLESLQMQFPSVFDLSPKAMRHITPAMEKLAVGCEDVEWKDGIIRYTSRSRYQTVSLCDRVAILKFTREQISRGIVSVMSAVDKGMFSQALFIPKKSGTPRWVVDFRRVNSVCWAWIGSIIPTVQVVKRVPAEWGTFTVLDLENGFFNIPLKPEIRPLFCCEVLGVRLIFNRLPQGWSSSACIFHDIVKRILSNIEGVVTYMDDILVGGATPEAHDQVILQVMAQLAKYGFHVNRSKMQWRQSRVEFLGFNIQTTGKVTMEGYVERQKKKLPRVTCQKELQRALGIANVLRHMVPNLAAHLAPYYEILKAKTRTVNWTAVEKNFDVTWARILGSSLALYRESSELSQSSYVLCTDWSGEGVGFSLYLGNRLVYLGSRRNKFWSRHVSSFLGEVDAIVWSLRESLWIIRGSRIIVRTDSESGQKKLNNPASWVTESDARVLRLLGWLLGNFAVGTQLTFEHISGKDNVIADQLSRWQHYKVEEETLPDQYGIEEIYTMSETEAIGLTEDKRRRLGSCCGDRVGAPHIGATSEAQTCTVEAKILHNTRQQTDCTPVYPTPRYRTINLINVTYKCYKYPQMYKTMSKHRNIKKSQINIIWTTSDFISIAHGGHFGVQKTWSGVADWV